MFFIFFFAFGGGVRGEVAGGTLIRKYRGGEGIRQGEAEWCTQGLGGCRRRGGGAKYFFFGAEISAKIKVAWFGVVGSASATGIRVSLRAHKQQRFWIVLSTFSWNCQRPGCVYHRGQNYYKKNHYKNNA